MVKSLTLNAQSPRQRPIIKVGVGYTWDGNVRSDKRWHALKTCLNVIVKEASQRAARELNQQITFDDDKAPRSTATRGKEQS